MTEKELIDLIAKTTGGAVAKAHTKTIVGSAFGEITKALTKGDDFSYSGFGKFYAAKTKERKGRNPKTGKELLIPAGTAPRFRQGKVLREAIK